MIKGVIKFKLNECLYFSALSLYIMRVMVRNSLYSSMLPQNWTRYVNSVVLILLLIKLLEDNRLNVKNLLVWISISLIAVIIALQNGYLNLFIIVLLIFSAHNIEFKMALKCIITNELFWSLLIVISCLLGILPDYTFARKVGSLTLTAHSLGFTYYSTIAYVSMTFGAVYLFFNRNCSYFKLFILVLFQIAMFFVHTTRLATIIGLFTLFVYIITVKWKLIKFQNKFWDYVIMATPLLACLATVGAVGLYASERFNISNSFFNTIVSRLNYSVQAFQNFGIKLFGSKIVMYGTSSLTYGDAEEGFYIDSGYIYMIVAYGIIFTGALIGIYVLLAHYIYICKDSFLYGWFMIILVMNSINNFMLSLPYNPLLLLIPTAIINSGKKKNILSHKSK